MTLNTRNKILLFINALTILTFLSSLAFYIFYALKGMIAFPQGKIVRNLFNLTSLTSPDVNAACLSILMFSFAAALESFIILRVFEKTQALEISFYIIFLISIFIEQQRLFLSTMPFIQGNRLHLEIVTRLVIISRILAPLSLLFSTIFNELSQRQNIFNNILIMLLVSAILGVFYPLNTEVRTSILTLGWGFSSVFMTVRVVFILAALTVLAYSAFIKSSPEYIKLMIGLLILSAGYFTLCISDNYFFLASGSILFSYGSFFYIKELHNMYKWH